jgi:hypothetical protein
MHVLYFHLKKLMEPPFSEYLVLLKTELRLVTHLFRFNFDFGFKKTKTTSKIIHKNVFLDSGVCKR